MAAVFPNNIKFFTTKHDLIDDVQASHINDMQNEITAVETNVGQNAHIWSPNFLGQTINYGNIANRLNAMQKMDQIPITRLKRDSVPVKNKVETSISFQRQNDPFNHYNLTDITVKTSGWWRVSAYGHYDHNDNGYRNLSLFQAGTLINRDAQGNLDQFDSRQCILSVHWEGLAHVGDRFSVTTYQNSGGTMSFQSVKLHADMIRSYDPALF